MADLIKMKMEAILDAIEQPIQLQGAGSVQDILEIDYRPAWDKLNSLTFIYNGSIESEQILMNYQQGRILLSSTWHQGDPYNSFCPIGDTTCISGVDRTVVGCAATAAAQIMQYWAWPPKGIGSHSDYWDGDD